MTTLPALALLALVAQTPAPVHDGRASQVQVAIPRIEEAVEIDGALDEPVWSRAARLSGFSQYTPVDSRAAEHQTEVLVWYSPTAIHFGVRAHAARDAIRATLAQRDRIESDDAIEIYLGTFNDHRQALLFGVNPFGVQFDGTLTEGARGSQGSGGFSGMAGGRESADLSQDFVFDSKGRLTDYGYEVEIRIPFKTLRYQSADTQDWSLHVLRRVQSTGHEDSWAPAARNASSFLTQSGTLTGLTGLRSGLVLDLTPVVTARADGTRDTGGAWGYDTSRPDFGGNARWGVTPNLTLNATVNPDFSQIEADATQFQFDPRQAVFFQEKRPFFLDGIEQFTTPNNLIYTRAIAAPLGAIKVSGKVSGTSVGVLAALDDDAASFGGESHPMFAIARVQRDLPGNARVAMIYTDRTEDGRTNRVAGFDARVPFGSIYTIDGQLAFSRDQQGRDSAVVAPLWQASVARNGRRYSFRYQTRAVDDDFRTRAGFISRAGVANIHLTNQLAFYGPKGGFFERYTADVVLEGVWKYNDFVSGRDPQDRKLHLNHNALFRGGWRAGASVLIETFGYDPDLYADHRLVSTGDDGDVSYLPFTGTPRLPNRDWLLQGGTPRVKGLQGNIFMLWGRDENYFEWASGDIFWLQGGVFWRPTEQLRADLTFNNTTVRRPVDDSLVNGRYVTRARVEYQLTRALSLRWVGEYTEEKQSDLRDDSRTNLPIAIVDGSGQAREQLGFRRRLFRSDALVSWQPTPGTVFFAGYGSTETGDRLRPTSLIRQRDGFFMKLSYLFRM